VPEFEAPSEEQPKLKSIRGFNPRDRTHTLKMLGEYVTGCRASLELGWFFKANSSSSS